MTQRFFVGLCLVLASCLHTTEAKQTAAVAPLHSAPLHFEEFGGKPFPYALVRVTLAGKPTLMILDTGATDHVIATSWAKKQGLTTVASQVAAFDHAGGTLSAAEIEQPQLVLDTWGAAPAAPVYAIDLPPVFETLGIGGILAPVKLVQPGEAVVIDFARRTLQALPLEKAQEHLTGHRVMAPACDEPQGGRKFFMPVSVGGVEARLTVDTGASSSDLRSTSPVLASLQSSQTAKGVSYAMSGRMETRTISNVALRLGDWSMTRDLDVIAESPKAGTAPRCAYDGVLGMDVLRACVLVLGPTAIEASCAP